MPQILTLVTPHGASHRRASLALRKAFNAIAPHVSVEVIDGLAHCARWFQAYYSSYELPLRLWPQLWGWIESFQHQQTSTGPQWLYRQGAKPLFKTIESLQPEVVIATEVGMCELASMHKRSTGANYRLVGLELMDFNQAWVQPEVDLYVATHPDLAVELVEAGAPAARVLTCGMPIDPAFAMLPTRNEVRDRLGLAPSVPVLLVLFGGAGHGSPPRIVQALSHVNETLQVVFITGRNPRLETALRSMVAGLANARVLGWVDNMLEWMTAADLLVSKPGGGTLMEAAACGLPMLAFDPLPGNEQRTCRWIEKWRAGLWIKTAEDLASALRRLLANPEELLEMRRRASGIARPRAAYDAAAAILRLLS
jgi:processive 1,2-diacylglycerol beta-glucosyltransferase